MATVCWVLTTCRRRIWHSGRRILIEQRNGFRPEPKKPEKPQKELQKSHDTARRSSFTPPAAEQVNPSRSNIVKQLYKPFIFTIGFSGCCFGIAAIWRYERLRNYEGNVHARWLENLRSPTQGEVRKNANARRSLTTGQKTVLGIIAANFVVFGLWKVPSMHRVMIQYFTSNPASKSLYLPMILSNFSHFSFFHVAVNMYILWSISQSVVAILGPEQFLALYMSAGVVSSFARYAYKIATGRLGTSLGAHGAIMAIAAVLCTKIPEAQMSILFLPIFTFTAGNALKVILALDSAGLVLGWKIFDHAAHLGGALFGIWYALYGHALILKEKVSYVQMWDELRGKPPRSGG